jgi:uridine phosphorylase
VSTVDQTRGVHDYPLFENDLDEAGVFSATDFHAPVTLPRVAVLCFFNELLGRLAEAGELEPIYTLRSEIGVNPVYRCRTPEGDVAVVHPGVGAPLAAGFLEEAAALGITTFVAVGGAGALDPSLDVGHAMIVTSALRDEGTSLHYAPPSRTLDADPQGVAAWRTILQEAGQPFFEGRAWTTDGLFRETPSRVARRIAEECRMVDMEASALMAVAQYRGLRLAHLLYAGDMVAGDTWDGRGWDRAHDVRERFFRLAVRTALHFAEVTNSSH